LVGTGHSAQHSTASSKDPSGLGCWVSCALWILLGPTITSYFCLSPLCQLPVSIMQHPGSTLPVFQALTSFRRDHDHWPATLVWFSSRESHLFPGHPGIRPRPIHVRSMADPRPIQDGPQRCWTASKTTPWTISRAAFMHPGILLDCSLGRLE